MYYRFINPIFFTLPAVAIRQTLWARYETNPQRFVGLLTRQARCIFWRQVPHYRFTGA
jgi:hypothetical protein